MAVGDSYPQQRVWCRNCQRVTNSLITLLQEACSAGHPDLWTPAEYGEEFTECCGQDDFYVIKTYQDAAELLLEYLELVIQFANTPEGSHPTLVELANAMESLRDEMGELA